MKKNDGGKQKGDKLYSSNYSSIEGEDAEGFRMTRGYGRRRMRTEEEKETKKRNSRNSKIRSRNSR